MVTSVDPREAQQLVAGGDVEIIDVRDPSEWLRGHVPGARNVPLGELLADVGAAVTRSRVLFVCARGVRSLTAANAAAQTGRTQAYSLTGGTQAWEAAGLPMATRAPRRDAQTASTSHVPVAPTTSGAASAAVDGSPPAAAPMPGLDETLAGVDSSCGLPEPALDAVVGSNLRELRELRGWTLDELARTTGLSRSLLGQIEMGRAAPSVSVVWRLARAFDVHFSALLATSERVETCVLRASKAKRLVSPDGRFSSRALYNLNEKTHVEFYELSLAGHSREDAQPHQPGTRENLIVTAGRLELEVGTERFELGKGDAIVFSADVAHSYINPGHEECGMYLVMTYAAQHG